MIKQWINKQIKIGYGLLNTHFRKTGHNYDDSRWWDSSFYIKGISDQKTISPYKGVITAKYHYASVEMHILRHLQNSKLSIKDSVVLDIGSGSGHWIDFYNGLGAGSITGLDVSLASFNHLKQKYSTYPNIEIHHGKALEIINHLKKEYLLVNAIGVMFHIVDDLEWQNTIYAISNAIPDHGMLVVGGHFGVFDALNVQIDKDGNINKRLRSKKHWKHILKKAGFKKVDIYRNNAYLWIDDTLPENNILIATK